MLAADVFPAEGADDMRALAFRVGLAPAPSSPGRASQVQRIRPRTVTEPGVTT